MATTQDAREQRFYAGLFRRRENLDRKEPENAFVADSERPSTSLADWLRMAHSLLDGKTAASAGELSNAPHE
jgi:hypothetical protein